MVERPFSESIGYYKNQPLKLDYLESFELPKIRNIW